VGCAVSDLVTGKNYDKTQSFLCFCLLSRIATVFKDDSIALYRINMAVSITAGIPITQTVQVTPISSCHYDKQ